MKKLLCSALIFVMSIVCAFALVGCTADGSETGGNADLAKKGAEQLRGLYMSEAEETPADYTRFGQIRVDGKTYPVSWEVSAAADSEVKDLTGFVTVGEMDASSKQVTISINKAEKEIKYVLTATVKVDTAEEKVSFDKKVPAKAENHAGTREDPYSAVNVQELAATLEANTFLMEGDVAKLVYVEGYIVETGRDYKTYAQFIYIVDEYAADKDRNAVDAVMILSISYDENSPVKQFSDIGKGDKILVSGYIQNYQNDATSALQPEVSRWKNPATNKYEPLTVVSLEKAVDNRTDSEKVSAALKTAEAELTTTVFTAATTYDLPLSSVYGVELSYASANTDLITVDGNKMTIKSIPETETTVKITMTAKIGSTEEAKEFTITLTKSVDLGTTHAGTQADPYDQADLAKLFATLGDGQIYSENGAEKEVYAKGYVTVAGEVSWNKDNTKTYGLKNVYIASSKDAAQADSVLIYSINWGEAMPKPADNTNPLKVGDEVVIKGYLKNYKGTYEVCQSSDSKYPVVVELNGNGSGTVTPDPSPIETTHAGTQADPYDQADLAKIFATLSDGQIYSENGAEKKVYVKGFVTVAGEVNWNKDNTNTYGVKNIYISSTKGAAQADSVLVYNTNWGGAMLQTADNTNPLKVGDEIVVEGYLKNYMGTYEVCQSSNKEYPIVVSINGNGGTQTPDPKPVETTHAGTQADPYDQADLAKIFATLEKNQVYSENGAEKQVYVKGFVTVAGEVNGNYGVKNVYISNTNGAVQADSVLIYSINWGEAMPKPADNTNPLKIGDEIVVRGYLKNYNGTYEVCQSTAKDYPVIVELTAGVDVRTDAQKVNAELAGAKLIKETYTSTGEFLLPTPKTEGVTFTWESSNTTLVTVEGVAMKVLALPEADTTVTLTLTATINQTQETKVFTLTIAAAPVVVPGQQTVSLSFADTAKRTSADVNSQVWEDNGIKFTNEKGASTNGVNSNYSNPVRCYKSSTVKVEAANMVKIVFNCNNANYATALVSSIGTVQGVTVDVADTVVTVTFATPTSSFEFVCSEQIRIDSIDVTTTTAAAPAAAALMAYNPMAKAAGVGSRAGSTTVSIILSEQGYSNGQEISSVAIDTQISLAFNKGTNNNAPKYYDTGKAVRVYAGGTLTVSAIDGYKITSIVLTFGSSDGSNTITANTDTYDSGKKTWTGSAQDIVFTVGGSSGNRRFASVKVTYESAADATDEDKVRAELSKLQFTDNVFTAEKKTLDLPATTSEVNGVTYAWSSDNEMVTFAENTMSVNTLPEKLTKATITLTATLPIQSDNTQPTVTKTFEIIVCANPPQLTNDGTVDKPYTVADVEAIFATLNDGETYQKVYGTDTQVYIKGIVIAVGEINGNYGLKNVYIADDKDALVEDSLLIANVNWGVITKPTDNSNPLQVSDIVTINGYLKIDNGKKVANSGSNYPEFTNLEKPELTPAEKIEIELKGFDNTLTDIVKPISVDLNTPSVGSEVTFTWTITKGTEIASINENNQLVVADTNYPTTDTQLELNLTATCGTEKVERTVTVWVRAPKQSIEIPSQQTASLSFADTTKRISWDKNSQIWKDNGITFTNEKDKSITNVADYAPVRCYKSSTVKVEAANMVKIVFNCNSASYATALVSSIGTVQGVTVKADAKVVTVTFATPTSSFEFVCSEQIRIDSIDVTTDTAAAPEIAQYIGAFNGELVYGTLSFLGAGLRTEGVMGVRYGFKLTLSTSNVDTINAVAAAMTGTFELTIGTNAAKSYAAKSYKIENNTLVVNAVLINIPENNEVCNTDITTKLTLTVGTTALTAEGTRKIADVAGEALQNGELTTEQAAKYGYVAQA